MAPVAAAIVAGIALSTIVRLRYAKPGKPHEPYAEGRERTELGRLAAAGWAHFAADFEPLVELPDAAGAVRPVPDRPDAAAALAPLLPGAWILPVDYGRLSVPAVLPPDRPATVHFQARLDNARALLIGFDLYRKDGDILVVPRWEQAPDGLEPRNRPVAGRMIWPAGALPAGRYRVTLLALRESAQWDLEIAAR